MSDESQLSKRERQKLRRERRLAEERAAARSARTRRLLATVVVVLLAVVGVGYFLFDWMAERRAEQAAVAAAQERFEELGCSEITQQPDLGQGHIPGDALAQNPPDALYQDRPASSGQHFGQWVQSGVYDKPIDERLLVHNLEHGYVNFYYAADAPEAEVAELKEFAREQIDGRYQKIVVAPFAGEFSQDANFATVAWGFRQFCDEFDEGVALAFLQETHGLEGNAPEKNLQPHLSAGGGTIDPDAQEGPLLLPPLDTQQGDATEAAAPTEPATTPSP